VLADDRIGTRRIDNGETLQEGYREGAHHPARLLRQRHGHRRVAQHGNSVGGGGGTLTHHVAGQDCVDEAGFARIEFTSHHHQEWVFEVGACLSHHLAFSHITPPLIDVVTQHQQGIEECHGLYADMGGVRGVVGHG
jgi:hypothetical protein